MIKINYKSDFDAILTVRDAAGVDIGYPTSNWTATFFTRNGGVTYIASHIDGVNTNCFDDEGKIHVVFDGHDLEPGYLKVKFEIDLPDMLYPDNVRNLVQLQMMDIMLVEGASDADLGLLSMLAQIPVLRGGDIDLSNYYTKPEVDVIAGSKQNTIVDLADIRSGARKGKTAVQPATLTEELNKKADKVHTHSVKDIKDMPTIPTKTSELINDRGFLTTVPDEYATEAELLAGLATKQDTIPDLEEIRTGAAAGAKAVQPATLTEGLNKKANKSHTHTTSDITDFPSIPTKTSELTNDSGFATKTYVDEVASGKQDKIDDLQTIRNNASTGAALADDVRDMTAQASLPTGGVLESGKTYGSPTSPLTVDAIDGTGVTTESVVYFNADETVTISYTGAINEAPTSGVAVVSFEQGIAVFGSITI